MPHTAPEPSHETIPIDLRRHTLDNGLRVVLHRDASLPLVTTNLWYHVGSKDEWPGRTGFAHLFEHMLFQGSQHVGTNDHFRYVQQAGGVANGSTWYDRTNYYQTLPSHQLELALWLESDRMGFLLPALTAEKLETQRSVVMNERRQRIDNQPYGQAFERLQELLWPRDFPYHWPVIGYMEDIEAATLEEVREFFSTWYRPNNAVLTVAGDLEPDAALEQVERWFDPIPAGKEVSHPAPELPEPGGEEYLELPDDVNLPRVYTAFRCPGFGEPDWHAADLLSTVLAGGKSSLLYQELVHRRELAQNVTSWISPTEIAASLVLVATARPGVSPAELERVLFDQIARVLDQPPEEERVEAARNRILTDLYDDLQRIDQRADLISQVTTFFDQPELISEVPARYGEFQPADLSDYARRFMKPEGRVTVTVVPKDGFATPREDT